MRINFCPNISIIIPVYNEEKRIYNTLIFLDKWQNLFGCELIFVDDGSIDKTAEIIKNFNFKGKVQFIRYVENRGKGYAVRRGLLSARYDDKMILDADLSVDPTSFLKSKPPFPSKSKNPFMVIGNRHQVKRQPLHRIIAGKGFKFLTWCFTGIYTDTQCPYKLLHNIPFKIISNLKTDGFAYDVELIKAIKDAGIDIHQQKVEYYNSEDSKVTFKKSVKMFFEILKI